MKKRILSGIQPSGNLHLGNYFGMMQRMIAYQEKSDLFCFIVNYHALTTQRDGALLRKLTREAAVDFLALGLNPDKCTFWVQSDVPEVTELTWVLSNITGMGLLERCHSYKDKIAQGIKPNHGLFSYPILMTADILIMQGETIPVGKDQKQHIEVARDIAQSFNQLYGETFKIPEPEIQDETGLLPGIDGRKMAKSYQNTIDLFGTDKELKDKVMGIKTDSTPVDQPKPIEDNPLFDLYSAFLDKAQKEELKKRFLAPGLKYGEVKKELLDVITKTFSPYRKIREDLLKSTDHVDAILKKGAQKARDVAAPTMKAVRKAVGI